MEKQNKLIYLQGSRVMKWTTEAKVGAFTVMGIILLISAIVFVGKVDLWPKPQLMITGEFTQVNGLKPGNKVKFSGVAIGNVEAIEIRHDMVAVTMGLDEDAKVPEDSTFVLGSDGFLGDKFIQISPGTSKIYLKNGATINGEGVDGMDKAMQSAQKLMEGTEKMLESINSIIGNPTTQGALRHSLESTATIADNTIAITQNMADVTAQLNQTAQQFDADGNAGGDMRDIITNMKVITARMDNMAHSMEGIVTDPTAANNIKETLHNTAQISAKINKITGGKPYGSSVTSGNNTGENMGDTKDSGKKSQLSTETSAELLYNNQKNEYRVNGHFRFFTNKTLGELGFSNIGDGTKFDLNGGKYLAPKLSLRGGLFESELGVSLDYGLGSSPFSLSMAMYDLNHQKYRLRSEVLLHDDLYAVLQITRPFGSSNGGTYFGIKQVF